MGIRESKCPTCGSIDLRCDELRTADAGPNAPAEQERRQWCPSCGWERFERWEHRALVFSSETAGKP